jgi:hypothetical protein
MDHDDVRRVALALDGSEERDHHGIPAFRTRRRIYASLPDQTHLHVMLPEEEIRDAVAEWPAWAEEKWWGRRLTALRVDLAACDPAVVAELLEDAWQAAH